MLPWHPLTYDDWRRIKAATRHRRYLERMAEADDASADAWLEACRRDQMTDPHDRDVRVAVSNEKEHTSEQPSSR